MRTIARLLRDLLPRLLLALALATAMNGVIPAQAAPAPAHQADQAVAMPHAPGHDCGTGHTPDAACFQACLGPVVMGDGPSLTAALQVRRLSQRPSGDRVLRGAGRAPPPRPPNSVFAETSVL